MFDLNGDGEVTLDEFKKVLLSMCDANTIFILCLFFSFKFPLERDVIVTPKMGALQPTMLLSQNQLISF